MDNVAAALIVIIGFCSMVQVILNIRLIRRNIKLRRSLEGAEKSLDGCSMIIAGQANEINELRQAAWDNECLSADDIRQQIADMESDIQDGEGWKCL